MTLQRLIRSSFLVCLPLPAQVDFTTQVHPILVARCTSCHSGEKAQAGLALNTRAEILRGGSSGTAVLPGNSKGSLILRRVTGEKEPRMPIGRDALPAAEIALLRQWIDEGAKGPAGTAAARWVAPLLPLNPKPRREAANIVDAFLDAPGRPVADNVFARRVYLDLWGLLPTPEQLAAFEKDQDPARREKLVDALLADSGNYTAHWISFWNDVLRNEEGVVYYGERQSITAWLRRALTENVPYDRFVGELINPPEKTGPAGFVLGVTWRGEVPASERPPLQAAQSSAQTFLGINLKCNSCHDSFISSWKLKDAYGLASFFSPEPLNLVRCDVDTGEVSKPKFLFPELGEPAAKGTPESRRAEAARFFTMTENGRLRRTLVNRYWKLLFGRGIVEPVDDMSAEPWNAELLDALAWDFAARGHNVKQLLKTMLLSKAYQLPSVKEPPAAGAKFSFRGPQRRRLTAEQYADALASITGEWRMKIPSQAGKAVHAREWEFKSTTLTRAMGRPVRDTVVTERLTLPTTLQSLELLNGQLLSEWLREGARRLAENPAPPPENLFDSGVVRRNAVKVNVKLDGARTFWLLVENVDSYDASRVIPQWNHAVLVRGEERVPLKNFTGAVNPERLRVPAALKVALPEGFERFEASVEVAAESKESDIGPAIRFFVFDREPDRKRLVKIDARTPVERPQGPFTSAALITRLYRHAFQRDPSEAERRAASAILGAKLTTDAVEDLLWMLLQSPEFQYIR
ncbi:MAG: DUF1549 domain-containing protein [Candidatus Solibacter usitatus]|nr:DUF1549 domain-containing protein [Candidatus Solibacter usitatus]